MIKEIKVFEAFAGIGAQRKAIQNVMGGGLLSNKITFKFVGLAEWCINAIVAYHKIHDNFKIINNVEKGEMIAFLQKLPLSKNSKTLVNKNYWNKISNDKLKIYYSAIKHSHEQNNIFDVKKLSTSNFKNIDLLCYSFPCQDISIQGKGKGISKGKQSSLLFEIKKYLLSLDKKFLPKYLLLENVKALLSSRHKKDFLKWIIFLNTLGYKTNYKILDSSLFGSPQKRERAFALSVLDNQEIELDEKSDKKKIKLKDILDKKFDPKYRLEKLEKYKLTNVVETKSQIKRCKLIDYTTFNSETYVYAKDTYNGCTLTASGANSRIKILEKNNQIRILNPKECFLYMGFNKEDFNKVKTLNILNDVELTFLAGNSIVVNVLESIFNQIIKWEIKDG